MVIVSHTLIVLSLKHSKKIKNFTGNNNIVTNIYRMQANNSVMPVDILH